MGSPAGAPSPLRPLLLGTGWFPDRSGGLERYCTDLFRALGEAGAVPEAVVVGPAPSAPLGVVVPTTDGVPLPLRLIAHARAARRAARRVDVVDAHFALYALLPSLDPVVCRVPFVVHFQGPWAEESASQGARPVVSAAQRRIERVVYRRADRIVVLSGAFKRILVERYGVLPWKVVVRRPGVDLERFTPGDRRAARAGEGLDPGAYVALAVRRLVPRMGLDVLLDAWPAVLESRPDAVLLLAGHGPSGDELHAKAHDLGIADHVRFLGRVDDDRLVRLYRAADVCVVPTVELEGFGLVTLEAMACGTPVIVTDTGGLADTSAELDVGTIVPPGDAEALGRRLGDASTGRAPLPSAERCRALAERHDWAGVARAHLDDYAALVDRTPRVLRVVSLDHTAQPSGAELALLRTLPALGGVDTHVVLAEDGPFVRLLERAGQSVEVLAMPEVARRLRKDRVAPRRLPLASVLAAAGYTLRLAVRLRRLRPDVVHSNSLKAALYGSVAGRLAGRPVVVHIRDRIDPDYLPGPAVAVVRWVVDHLATGVVANSATTLETLRLRRVPGEVVHDSAVLSPSTAGPMAAEPGPRRIGMVGRLASWKGQDVFLRAFASAHPPPSAARAVLVGAALFGEADCEARLHRLADELGIVDRVDFLGHRDDVEQLLSTLDVLVHASVIPEPFGQVVLEGMAAGLPVVAAGAGGPSEIVTHGVDGLLHHPGDVEDLAARLRELEADPELGARLGAAARCRAEHLTPERQAPLLAAAYRRALIGAPSSCGRSRRPQGEGAMSASALARLGRTCSSWFARRLALRR